MLKILLRLMMLGDIFNMLKIGQVEASNIRANQ